jgi:hypothetical protein
MLLNFLKFISLNTKATFSIALSTSSKSMKHLTDSYVMSRFVGFGPTTVENTHPRRWPITSFNTALLTNSQFPEIPNRMARQLGGITWEKAESFLKLAGLPAKFWPEMVKTANYIRMRSPQARVQTTPYEAWHGEPPRYSHLRTPGTKCWAI